MNSTKQAILNAAIAAIGDHGAEVTVHQIAEASGYSVGSLYNHFDDRDDLYAAAGVEAFDQFATWARPALERIKDPAERIATFGRYFTRMPDSHPRLATTITQTQRFIWGPKYKGNQEEILARDVAEGVLLGLFDPHLIEVRVQNTIGAMLHHVSVRLLNPDMDPRSGDNVIEVAMLGLGLEAKQAKHYAHQRLPRRPHV